MSRHAVPIAWPRRLTIVKRPEFLAGDNDSLALAVRTGLLASPKTLPCTHFYDEVGSHLFEKICRLPEYYLTRTEDAILAESADAMVAGWCSAPALIELGSGSASKTRRLIAALLRRYGSAHYAPIDVSPACLEESARRLVQRYDQLRVTAFVARYQNVLDAIPERFPGPKLFVFLGSSVGNFEETEAVDLLGRISRSLDPSDRFLLGTDLVKDPATLIAAYDDAQGVTAQFNKNLLVRINQELGADFDLDGFEHRAVWREGNARIEMHLVSRASQVVAIPGAEVTVRFNEGESIHTENSHKYTPERLGRLAELSGFAEESAWTDLEGRFRLQLWRPRKANANGTAPL